MSAPEPIAFRVHSVSTEMTSARRGASPTTSTAPTVMTVVTLVPHREGFDVLGGQQLLLHISGAVHPLLQHIGIDQVFELRPAPAPPHPSSPGRNDP